MATAWGTVFRSGGKERIPFATVKATYGNLIEYTTADDAGSFSLAIPKPGLWDFVGLEKGSFVNNPVQVDMSQDQADIKIYLDRIAETVDDKAGRTFFWSCWESLVG